MPIAVTCPSCLTRFSVSDKYAGKSGPCPKCKGTIKIPEKSDEVVIHAPEDKSPKDTRGRSIFKPIRREEVKLSLPVILSATLGTIVVFGIALGFGVSKTPPPALLVALAVPLLALPIVVGGYWFLRDDDLEGYSGKELWIRCAICAFVFSLGWALYAWVPSFVNHHASMTEVTNLEMLVMIALMIVLGTVAAVLCFELEVPQGIGLYMLYFILTFLLAWVSGTPLANVLPGNESLDSVPAVREPAETSDTEDSDSKKEASPGKEPPSRDIPRVLQ